MDAFANVLPSLWSWLLVTLMAVTGIVLLKWITAQVPIPGVSSVIQAA